MDSQISLQLVSSLKIFWLFVFSFLYAWGGIKGKWKRRFVAPVWLVGGIMLSSHLSGTFSWWYLTYLPLLIAALTLGYGADRLGEKIRKRTLYGLALSVAPIALPIINAAWWLYAMHCTLCVGFCVVLGVYNINLDAPVGRGARDEETLIGFVAGFLPLFMV